MTVPALPAEPRAALGIAAIQAFYPRHAHAPAAAAETTQPISRHSSPARTLDLSASRTHDTVLDILGAYKLTGNFHINLEIVLKELGVFDQVAYTIEPETPLPFRPDCRHVAFRPNPGVGMDAFGEIMQQVTDRIGFDAKLSWWERLFR
jgi:hypothetical protein